MILHLFQPSLDLPDPLVLLLQLPHDRLVSLFDLAILPLIPLFLLCGFLLEPASTGVYAVDYAVHFVNGEPAFGLAGDHSAAVLVVT